MRISDWSSDVCSSDLLNRLAEPTGGQILFDGDDVSILKGRALMAWRARCAMIFQQFNLVGRLDVITNVLLGRLNHHGFATAMLKRFSPAERAFAIRPLDRPALAPNALPPPAPKPEERRGRTEGG